MSNTIQSLYKEKLLALGVYPEISLSAARELRDEARKKLKQNIEPLLERKQAKVMASIAATNQFETVAMEWLDKQKIVGRLNTPIR